MFIFCSCMLIGRPFHCYKFYNLQVGSMKTTFRDYSWKRGKLFLSACVLLAVLCGLQWLVGGFRSVCLSDFLSVFLIVAFLAVVSARQRNELKSDGTFVLASSAGFARQCMPVSDLVAVYEERQSNGFLGQTAFTVKTKDGRMLLGKSGCMDRLVEELKKQNPSLEVFRRPLY